MPTFAGVELPPLKDGWLEKLRVIDGVKYCDQATVNPDGRKEKRAHHWQPFEFCFPATKYSGGNMIVEKELREQIPNWSWCNFCWGIDTTRRMCEEPHVHGAGAWSSHRCHNQGVVYEEDPPNWMTKREHPEIKGPMRWWCKMHSPVRIATVRATKAAIEKAQREAVAERNKREQEKRDARNELQKLALEVEEWMTASGIHNEDEWARTLYTRIATARSVLEPNSNNT